MKATFRVETNLVDAAALAAMIDDIVTRPPDTVVPPQSVHTDFNFTAAAVAAEAARMESLRQSRLTTVAKLTEAVAADTKTDPAELEKVAAWVEAALGVAIKAVPVEEVLSE